MKRAFKGSKYKKNIQKQKKTRIFVFVDLITRHLSLIILQVIHNCSIIWGSSGGSCPRFGSLRLSLKLRWLRSWG